MTSFQRTSAIAYRAARGILANGGATLAVKAGQSDPTTGYVVADGSHEQTADLATIDPRLLVAAYVDSHRAALAQTGAYLGAWVNDGYLVLDVVNVLPERNVALNAARDRGERAIFNLATGETLWTHKFFTFAGPYATSLQDSHGKA